jgi:hypothetical protein
MSGDVKAAGVAPQVNTTNYRIGRAPSLTPPGSAVDSKSVIYTSIIGGFASVIAGAGAGAIADSAHYVPRWSVGIGIGTGLACAGITAGAAYLIGHHRLDRDPIAPEGSSYQTVQDAEALYNAVNNDTNYGNISRTQVRMLIEKIQTRGWPLHEALVDATLNVENADDAAAIDQLLMHRYGSD